jgi:hypothetical protein
MPAQSGMTLASRLFRRKEKTIIALYDHLQGRRAELRGCYMTAALQAELANAIAHQAERDRAFDLALDCSKREAVEAA